MTTALDLITQALKAVGTLGVGQTALAEDYNDSFLAMKQMLAQWQRRRWLVPALQDISRPGNNRQSNTIGAGGYYNVPRPDKINGGYLRLFGNGSGDFNNDFNNDFSTVGTRPSNAVDYPLTSIESYENYINITLKGLNSFPYTYFYDGAFPLGNIFVWPIPSAQYEIHFLIKMNIANIQNQTDVIILPPEYEEAIWSNLAIRLCINYQVSASKELVTIAKVALNTIRNANTQIPTLKMPFALRNGPGYNFYSDV